MELRLGVDGALEVGAGRSFVGAACVEDGGENIAVRGLASDERAERRFGRVGCEELAAGFGDGDARFGDGVVGDGGIQLEVVQGAVVRLAVHEQPFDQRVVAHEDVHAGCRALLVGIVPGCARALFDGGAAFVGLLRDDGQDGQQRLLEHRIVLDHIGCHGDSPLASLATARV